MSAEKKGSNSKRIVLLVVGVLVFLLGSSLFVGGLVLLVLNTGTDKDGFAWSNVYEVRSSACAFALWVAPATVPSQLSWLGVENLAEAKWRIESVNSSKTLFVGWTKEAEGATYVNSFQFETPPSWNWSLFPYAPKIDIPASNVYHTAVPSRSPAEETFWLDSGNSSELVDLEWSPFWDREAEGRKVLVVMNLDGSNGVEANVQLGFKVPLFGWFPYLLIGVGLLLMCVVLFVFRKKKLVRFLAKKDS